MSEAPVTITMTMTTLGSILSIFPGNSHLDFTSLDSTTTVVEESLPHQRSTFLQLLPHELYRVVIGGFSLRWLRLQQHNLEGIFFDVLFKVDQHWLHFPLLFIVFSQATLSKAFSARFSENICNRRGPTFSYSNYRGN